MSLRPSRATFHELCLKHPERLIPLCRSFLSDALTPVVAFRRLAQSKSRYGFLLESVERGERMGRFSFVGIAPEIVFKGNVLPEPYCIIENSAGEILKRVAGDPIKQIERYLQEHAAVELNQEANLPPFVGGAVGALGYDCVRLFEQRLMQKPPSRKGLPEVPDLLVPIYRTIVAFDHVKNLLWIIHHADPRIGVDTAYEKGKRELDALAALLNEPVAQPLAELSPAKEQQPAAISSNFKREDFLQAVSKAKEFIAAGDIIQVVLSQRFSRKTAADPFEVYRSLRSINPSPYLFYLYAPEVHLVGSSPEVLVRVENGLIVNRPIAGTRPRGKTREEDAALASELLADEKERAEHVMLLDLGRNDIGRVSKYDSVVVTEKMAVEYYSHVMHIVSNVQGQLRDDLNDFDVLRACLPAGTLSGAPKIRAMEIIDALEPDARGIYGGAVGMMDWHGNMNTCIAIRTFALLPQKDGTWMAHVQAGAGIVADSVPENEYLETQNKARALLRALEEAEVRRTGK